MVHKKRNIIDKIWESHLVAKQEGFPDLLGVDLHLLHEMTSPQAFEQLRARNIPFHAPQRSVGTIDHIVSTGNNRFWGKTAASKKIMQTFRDNCKFHGVPLLDIGSGKQGIVHVIGPELGLTQPGMTIVCGDSHTSTHGAVGAIAFGVGTTQVGHVMASGCLLIERPKTMKVAFQGKLGAFITGKDLILKLIQQIGTSGGTGYIFEYCGEAIRQLSQEARLTICNMSIEAGARAGLISPDETTFNYLKGRLCSPKGDEWETALRYWKSLVSPPDAHYDASVVVDIQESAPMVSWGIDPSQCIEIDRKIPALTDFTPQHRDTVQTALNYTGLRAGQSLQGVPIDYAFIGSCTNGRIEDLRAAAQLLQGKKKHPKVRAIIVPGSEEVQKQAIEEGLAAIFEEAGCEFRNPGCSACIALNEDVVPEGKRCASTTNRNFMGRQGKGAITHLMSPAMTAAAIVTGEIYDVRKL